MFLRIPPALHHRRFRLLWLGLMVSVVGTQMQTWAIFWHIRVLTNQPIAVSAVGLVRILPVIVFSLIGGVMADAINRRKLLFITQTTMALAALGLAWLTYAEHIALWQIYALTAISAVAAPFDTPARQSLVPNLVPKQDLPNAFSMNSIASQVGSIVGPALSGLVIASLGLASVYLFNAISFVAVMLALLLMGPVEQQIQRNGGTIISMTAIQEGIQFIRKQPIISSSMVLDFFATFFASANTLMPFIAVDVLHVGVIQYGWLSAAQAIGAIAAALILSQVKDIRRQGPIFLGAVMVFGAATIVFGFSTAFWLAMLTLIIVGASDTVSTIIRNTIRQLQTPDYIRGRMVGVNQIFFMGGPQLGEVEAGAVAQFFGAPFAIISGGAGCILAVAWIVRKWPQLLKYNGDEPIPTQPPAN